MADPVRDPGSAPSDANDASAGNGASSPAAPVTFNTVLDRTRAWFEHAHAAGWLDQSDLARLAAVEKGTPADLFVDQQARPLVVAFFGGTGVGKSSLLNRLAGAEIARAGVERPTSREVTVYVHESVKLADLPDDLPIETVRIKRHSSDDHRDVLWIDAPDIDSTEEANRRAALAWLPHVDLVCYVVSPERYRDDVGWCVLRRRGHRHGWMFILNRWDEGDPQQDDDFARLLSSAGFDHPLLLRTCCLPGRTLPSADQFDDIQATLAELIQAHGVRELTRLGHRARLQELRHALQTAEKRLGDDDAWQKLGQAHRANWMSASASIREGAEWSLRVAAGRLAATESGLLGHLRRGVAAVRESKAVADQPSDDDQSAHIDEVANDQWDDWAQGKIVACLDATELAAGRAGLAAGPIRRHLDGVADQAGRLVTECVGEQLRAALVRPGSALGRLARRVTGFLTAFMPAAALVWVAYAVVRGYYRATLGRSDFLGGTFAINSILLVLIAWALPFALDRLLRPSLERTVLAALRRGLRLGLDEFAQALEGAWSDTSEEAAELRTAARQLLKEVAGLLIKPIDARLPALSRLMVHSQMARTRPEPSGTGGQ